MVKKHQLAANQDYTYLMQYTFAITTGCLFCDLQVSQGLHVAWFMTELNMSCALEIKMKAHFCVN